MWVNYTSDKDIRIKVRLTGGGERFKWVGNLKLSHDIMKTAGKPGLRHCCCSSCQIMISELSPAPLLIALGKTGKENRHSSKWRRETRNPEHWQSIGVLTLLVLQKTEQNKMARTRKLASLLERRGRGEPWGRGISSRRSNHCKHHGAENAWCSWDSLAAV